jgi:tetratricopeptide (TPR) repeat protein
MRFPPNLRVAAALCVAALVLFPGAGLAAKARLPIAGVDPLPQVARVEERAIALVHLVGAGAGGAALVHVGDADGFAPLAADAVAALREMAARGDAAGLRRATTRGRGRLVTGRNLLRAAVALGAAREVVWVLSDGFMRAESPQQYLRAALALAGVPAAEIATLAPRDGGFALRCEGVTVRIVPMEGLPKLAGPVLLNLDASSISHLAAARKVTSTSVVRALVRSFGELRYAAAAAVVAAPVEEGLLPMRLRWVADELADALRDPRLLAGAEPPTLWADYERLTKLISEPARHSRVDALYKAAVSEGRLGPSAALAYLSAEALVASGEYPRALEYAEESCRRDAGYCFGLQELGVQLLEHGEAEAAQVFFDTGERLRPGMAHALLDRGLALVRLGKPEAAGAPFEAMFAIDGDYTAAFVAGALEVQLKDRAAARRYFDAALAALPPGPLKPGLRREIVAGVAVAAAFYREEKLEPEAARLDAALGVAPPPAPASAPAAAPAPAPAPAGAPAPSPAPTPAR